MLLLFVQIQLSSITDFSSQEGHSRVISLPDDELAELRTMFSYMYDKFYDFPRDDRGVICHRDLECYLSDHAIADKYQCREYGKAVVHKSCKSAHFLMLWHEAPAPELLEIIRLIYSLSPALSRLLRDRLAKICTQHLLKLKKNALFQGFSDSEAEFKK